MITEPRYPGCYLLTPEDLRRPANQDFQNCSQDAFKTIRDWALEFLCRPHSQLGRSGAVCPYTAPAIKKNLFWMTACQGRHIELVEARDVLMRYCDWFLSLPPVRPPDSSLKTILILFPEMTPEQAPLVVDQLQRDLKPQFVARGLMLGQFHPNCAEGGLWNREFRPLQSPIPLLAIRNMVATDKPFLQHDSVLMGHYQDRFQREAVLAA